MSKTCYAGIDIGSVAAKAVVLRDGVITDAFTIPTGWSGKETAALIRQLLAEKGCAEDMKCVATGYGRVCVDYAQKIVTEITCHGKGAFFLFGKDCTIIDVGGQDTKIIYQQGGQVRDFLMNDKCAAGTGKFIEVMASRLGVGLDELYGLAAGGNPLPISAMCTVFAESEVISHIGRGERREDIAAGVIDSVASRVAQLAARFRVKGDLVLTGGLCGSESFLKVLSQKTGQSVGTHPDGRYAGAIGAALIAAQLDA